MDKHLSILDIHYSARKICSRKRLALPEYLPENGHGFGHRKTGVGVFGVFSKVCVRDASRNIGFESRSSHHRLPGNERFFGLNGAKTLFAPPSFPTEGRLMLRIRGTTYHFRRIVPPALRSVLNQREIWVSLKTCYQSEARKRASLFHARTTELFDETFRTLAEGQERPAIPHVRDALNDLHRLVDSAAGIEAVPLPVSRPRPRPQNMRKAPKMQSKPQPLLLSEALARFVLKNPHASADTKKATQRAVELFL
ncbi:hypothetical protein PY792_11975 [Gluconobacter sphaericus]